MDYELTRVNEEDIPSIVHNIVLFKDKVGYRYSIELHFDIDDECFSDYDLQPFAADIFGENIPQHLLESDEAFIDVENYWLEKIWKRRK